MYSKVISCSILGINGVLTYVEADSSNGLPNFSMVGNLSSSVKEAGDRVRTALKNSNIDIPAKKVTINISPADIRKDGTSYDLPIAIAILKSLEMINNRIIDDYAFLGEINLSGEIIGVRGVLSMVSQLKKEGIKGVIVPKDNEQEALVIDGIDIISSNSLTELIDIIKDENTFYNKKRPQRKEEIIDNDYQLDFKDVNGQVALKRACEIAVSGFHNIIISGPAGTGKTMIAKRIPTIMPELTIDEAIEITKVNSIAGILVKGGTLVKKRPFRSPHHSISVTSLIGGGVYPRPGEISLATCGVLFLDEMPLFSRTAIETLRQPLEDKYITINRLKGSFSYPANFLLVGAMNLCPCGHYPNRNKCKCSEVAIERYQRGISKPILERMDICAEASSINYSDIAFNMPNESSISIRKRVMEARKIQKERFKDYKDILYNGQMTVNEIKKYCILNKEDSDYLKQIFNVKKLSARTYHKLLRVARTIADLDSCEQITKKHLSEAANYRGLEEHIYA